MVLDNTKLLLRLLWRPADAMSGILDQGSLLFASLAVLAVSLFVQYGVQSLVPRAPVAVQHAAPAEETERADQDQPALPVSHTRPWWSFSFYAPLLVLAVVYVPGTLLVTSLMAHLGGFGSVFERDYSPLLTCTAMAWAAVNLPVALAAMLAPLPVLAAVAALACVYFAILMFFAVRTVFGTENAIAAGSVCLSVIPLVASVFFLGASAIRFRVARLAFLFVLCVLLSRRRVPERRRRAAPPAEFPAHAGRRGDQSARRRGAISTRTHLPAAPPIYRGHSAIQERRSHRFHRNRRPLSVGPHRARTSTLHGSAGALSNRAAPG